MDSPPNDNTADDNPLRRGSQESLSALISENQAALYEFIDKRTGPHLRRKIDVEDILQEVLADAFRSLQDGAFVPDMPLQWLYALCERKIIDTHRRLFGAQKRDAGREAKLGSGVALEELLVASMTTPSAAFSRNEKELRMLAALETLPDDQREAMRLRYLLGQPSKQIAQTLGKTDGAIRVMLSRGVARLQELLTE